MQVKVDNLMILPDYECKVNCTEDDVWAVLEDTAWEDKRDNNFKEEF